MAARDLASRACKRTGAGRYHVVRTLLAVLAVAVLASTVPAGEAQATDAGMAAGADLSAAVDAAAAGLDKFRSPLEVTDPASAQRQQALSEGQRLREEARKRARERAKQQKDGQPSRDLAAEAAEAQQAKLHRSKPKHERRALEKDKRRHARRRILEEAAAETRRLEQDDGRFGRRLQEESTPKPSCSDGQLSEGFETDVDCGGDCRDTMVLNRGVAFPLRCSFAQRCEINADCLGGVCSSGRCAARAPFAIKTTDELVRNMHHAYFHLAEQKGASTLDAQDVDEFFNLVFNPDRADLSAAQTTLLAAGLDEFKATQGLLSAGDPVPVTYGFLVRGRSLKFAQTMIADATSTAAGAGLRREL